MTVKLMAINSKIAGTILRKNSSLKNVALKTISNLLIENTNNIIEENKKDIELAKKNHMTKSMIDRLTLTETRIKDMADSVLSISSETDPVNCVLEGKTLENNLKIEKITVPLGVIGIIYESRPNVTVDCAALCLKSSNTVILRGGKEAFNSNNILVNIMRTALELSGLPQDCVQLVTDTSRESATEMMLLNGYIDVLIPRGGAGLIKSVVETSKVPVIETGVGNCHIYIDNFADIGKAINIVYNAKCSRPSVCNAAETLLIHKDIAKEILPLVQKKLETSNVIIKACPKTMKIIDNCEVAQESDWYDEFLDYVIAIKIVDDIDSAISHIATYSSGHSESIITENYNNSEKFLSEIDSAVVYVNASTRFTDGGVFGFGAEIGISTQKLHARGPMGLRHLVSYKYIVRGNGQVR